MTQCDKAGKLLSGESRFHEKMLAMAEALTRNRETKGRYAHARQGGKEWFCYSRWIAEDRSRWVSQEAIEYRDSLVSWLGSIDIVYVLQFETDAEIVAYLKDRLIAAVERETAPDRLKRRARLLEAGLNRKPVYYGKTTSQLAAQYGSGGGTISRLYSAMKGHVDYLRGNSTGASHWAHPDCHLYLEWHNRYYAPTCGLYRVQ